MTISKIRFLESQGLVNPERTPSGYRKFYEHDVERLRWVLRQQREHFLPLKVIKDRLDDEGDEATVASPVSVGATAAGRRSRYWSASGRRPRRPGAGRPDREAGRHVTGRTHRPGSGGTTLPGIEPGRRSPTAPQEAVAQVRPRPGGCAGPPRAGRLPRRLDAPESRSDRACPTTASGGPVVERRRGPSLRAGGGECPRTGRIGTGWFVPALPGRGAAAPTGRGGSPAGRSGTGASEPAVSTAASPPGQSDAPAPSDPSDPIGSHRLHRDHRDHRPALRAFRCGRRLPDPAMPPKGPTDSRSARPRAGERGAGAGAEPAGRRSRPAPACPSRSWPPPRGWAPVLEELVDFGLLAGTTGPGRCTSTMRGWRWQRWRPASPSSASSRVTCACTRTPPTARPASSSRSCCPWCASGIPRPGSGPTRRWTSWPHWASSCGRLLLRSALRQPPRRLTGRPDPGVGRRRIDRSVVRHRRSGAEPLIAPRRGGE